jgi:uncharacterized protein (TIGR03435 family)
MLANGTSGYTLLQLSQFFQNNLDRPMVDMTGLHGYYDIDLFIPRSLSPDEGASGQATFARIEEGWSDSAFFEAMEKQLGLKVEKKKVPVEFLVIDHLEAVPTVN